MKKYGNQFWIHNGPMSNQLVITVNQISEMKKKNDLGNFSPNAEGHKDKNHEENKEIWKTERNDPIYR